MKEEHLYSQFAEYYDKIYAKKDYHREVEFIEWAVNEHSTSSGKTMLDVACGTGNHALLLKNNFEVLGLDLNHEMLKIAKEKVPELEFIQGDMKNMDLEKIFDAIICMFSAINYNTNEDELEKTLRNFYMTLESGGLLIFDLGLNRENWVEGRVSVDTVVEKDLELARIGQSHLENGVFNASFVFLVKKNGKMDFSIDQHELGIFETGKVLELMEDIGFKTVVYDEFTSKVWDVKSEGRPVFVGLKH
ncbi:class I SAM-dependent DNA methyltransferase [Methanobacterium alcaliphilum]|uniref:class I SAM-dependent DNA methyltransferase n=1 Tax=Methanobacterium alcaliphilum TaxID=392018 RepID=UPI00200B359D|nr:class I SAM-dependent methyltransferase [Methanobacterium alcaliphilum]MCK9151903.1 methyltransferase domain-containing protein [Methanobacterium alcaliphilum]